MKLLRIRTGDYEGDYVLNPFGVSIQTMPDKVYIRVELRSDHQVAAVTFHHRSFYHHEEFTPDQFTVAEV